MSDKFLDFAPIIVVVVLFFWQNNVFVRPEQLEKKHREILDDIKDKYVEINAYKEFQTHIYSKLDEIKELLTRYSGES
ncbi:hypothetical protein IJ531_00810 [bacterium]|nr:hypothetical protein [bacterium]